ncbi:MAG: class I SAM-dependent methyltransferase [Wenzhouxiangella sp.]
MKMQNFMLSGLLAASLSAPLAADDRLRAAVDDPARPAAEAERDVHRNPFETLSFFGIRPDMTVIELSPSVGWYTEILGPYLAAEGRFIAAHWNMERENLPEFVVRGRAAFEERIADTERFGDIEIIPFEPPAITRLGEPGSADLVLTFRNVHGYKRAGTFGAVLDAAYEVLASGGVLGVVGHRLPEDREQDPEARSGYVHQSWVIEQAEAHGFRFAEASEVNANPRDTADHPSGVWSLLPSLRDGEETAAQFREIGESDRFTLKFVKP